MFFFDPFFSPKVVSLVVKRKTYFEIALRNELQEAEMLSFFKLLKFAEELQFKLLMDLFVVDLLKRSPISEQRFQVVYNLLSIKRNMRLNVRLLLSNKPKIYTLTALFDSANCLERESWDMFGVFFLGHPDLRRILTDYGFSGFPLRKDYPLTGFFEVRFDDELKRVVFDNLEVSQEYRMFDFLSPWEMSK